MTNISLVDKMGLSPAHCMVCFQTPFTDEGSPEEAIDLGVDVNFGDQAYLCLNCARIVAGLIDYVPDEEHEQVVQERDDLNTKLEEVREEFEAFRERVKRLVQGKKAAKELKGELKAEKEAVA